jgi:hypothetical protein
MLVSYILGVAFTPPATMSTYASSVLKQRNLTYWTIPTIPLVGGNQALPIDIPEGGWKDDYEFNAYMYPWLSKLFPGGTLINSESHVWLDASNRDLKPDFFFWTLGTECLISATAASPNNRLPIEGCIYGRPSKDCEFMVDILLKGKITKSDTIPLEDIGTMFKCLDTLSRRHRNRAPRSLLYNAHGFVVASFVDGSLASIYRGTWSTPGCLEAIHAYLSPELVNDTVQGLTHFLQTNHGWKIELVLGRGRFGCVFQVTQVTASNKKIEKPSSFALKVVSVADAQHENIEEEFQRLSISCSKCPDLVARAVPNSLMVTSLFVYYSIRDIGNPVNQTNVSARTVFLTLCQLHEAGIVHGDPHRGNLIVLPDDTLRWIDLRFPVGRIVDDVMILVKDVFGRSVCENEKVQQYALDYQSQVCEARIVALYELCKNVTN